MSVILKTWIFRCFLVFLCLSLSKYILFFYNNNGSQQKLTEKKETYLLRLLEKD